MACPEDSGFLSRLPVLDLTEMNTLLQLSYVAQQCLYAGEPETQEREMTMGGDGVFIDVGEQLVEKVSQPPPTEYVSWIPYDDHNYAKAPPTEAPPTDLPMSIDDISCHTTVTTSNDVTDTNQESWEGSVTRCICEFKHDDGYMICCDRCGVWQHVDCMGVERSKIPDIYLCELCEPRFVDKHHAIRCQARKREILLKMGTLTDSDDEKRRSVKKPPGRKKHERRRTVSTAMSGNRGQRPARTTSMQEDSSPPFPSQNVKNVANRRNSLRTSKFPETSTSPPESGSSIVTRLDFSSSRGHTASFRVVNNLYSSEVRDVIAGLHRINDPENLSPTTYWPGPPSREACAVFQATEEAKGLKANRALEAERPIIEYTGRVMMRHQHRLHFGFEQFTLFYSKAELGLDVCIEAGDSDGVARFVRRSCRPNAEVRHIFDSSGVVRFYIWSLVNILRGSEITIPFDQDNITSSDAGVVCFCGLASSCRLLQNNTNMRKSRPQGKRSSRETAKGITPTSTLTSSGGVSQPSFVGRRRRLSSVNSSDVQMPAEKLDRLNSSPAKTDRPTAVQHTGSCGQRKPRSARQTSAEASDCVQNKDEARKLTREEKKLEAIMKVFERIQKDGPKRVREPNPEKRSRRRSAKSESMESKACEDLEKIDSKASEDQIEPDCTESKISEDQGKFECTESKASEGLDNFESTESKASEDQGKTEDTKLATEASLHQETESNGEGEEEEMKSDLEWSSGKETKRITNDRGDVGAENKLDEVALKDFDDPQAKCENDEAKKEEKEEDKVSMAVLGERGSSSERLASADDGAVEVGVKSEFQAKTDGICAELKIKEEEKTDMEISNEWKEIKEENNGAVEKNENNEQAVMTDENHSTVISDPGRTETTSDPEKSCDVEVKSEGESSAVKAPETAEKGESVLRRSKRVKPTAVKEKELNKEPSVSAVSSHTNSSESGSDAVENSTALKTASAVECSQTETVVRPKGRPKKATTKGKEAAENDADVAEEKKSSGKEGLDRIRTRSSTREETIEGSREIESIGRPGRNKLVKSRSQMESRQTSRIVFSKTIKMIVPIRNSTRIRHTLGRATPAAVARVAAPEQAEKHQQDEIKEPTVTSDGSDFMKTRKLLLSESRIKSRTFIEIPDCTSSESDLEYSRGMLSPSETPVAMASYGGSYLRNPGTSLWPLPIEPTLHLGSAKKRWLRQAINEGVEPVPLTCEPVPSSTEPVSTSGAEAALSPSSGGFTTPLKKRRVTIEAELSGSFQAAAKLTWSDDATRDDLSTLSNVGETAEPVLKSSTSQVRCESPADDSLQECAETADDGGRPERRTSMSDSFSISDVSILPADDSLHLDTSDKHLTFGETETKEPPTQSLEPSSSGLSSGDGSLLIRKDHGLRVEHDSKPSGDAFQNDFGGLITTREIPDSNYGFNVGKFASTSVENRMEGDRENVVQNREGRSQTPHSSDYEVTTSTVDPLASQFDDVPKRKLQVNVSPGDQTVTCSSGMDDREPEEDESFPRMEKEDGEITDDEPDDCGSREIRQPPGKSFGITSSEITSTNFQWNYPRHLEFRGGRGWRGNRRGSYRPFRFRGGGYRGGFWQKPAVDESAGFRDKNQPNVSCQEDSHVDSSSATSSPKPKRKLEELVVGSPITSDDDDDLATSHSSLYFKELESSNFTERHLSEKDFVSKQDDDRKENQTRRHSSPSLSSSSSLSSSESEKPPSCMSNQQGTKRKMSLMEYRKRMRRKRKSQARNDVPSKMPPASSVNLPPSDATLMFHQSDGTHNPIGSVACATAMTLELPVKSLSLTERLRFEFGVDASDETDDTRADEEADDQPPPPPPPPPPCSSIPLLTFRSPGSICDLPPLPTSPEPPPPPPPPPPEDAPPPPPPSPPLTNSWPKLERLVHSLSAMLSAQSGSLTGRSPSYVTSQMPGVQAPVRDRMSRCGQPESTNQSMRDHFQHGAGSPQGNQYIDVQRRATVGNMTPGNNAASCCPASVKVEHLASVRRQTPRPVAPPSLRFIRNASMPADTSPLPLYDVEGGAQSSESDSMQSPRSGTRIRRLQSWSHEFERGGQGLIKTDVNSALPFVHGPDGPALLQHPRLHDQIPEALQQHQRNRGVPPCSSTETISAEPFDGNTSAEPERFWQNAWKPSMPMTESTKVVPLMGEPPEFVNYDRSWTRDQSDPTCSRGQRYNWSSSTATDGGRLGREEVDRQAKWSGRRNWERRSGSQMEDGFRGGHGDETAESKVVPLMSIKSCQKRQFSDECRSVASPMYDHQKKRSHFYSDSRPIDVGLTETNATRLSANRDSTDHDSQIVSLHNATDFAGRNLDAAASEHGPRERQMCRGASRNDFIRSSLERNRACQAILRKQMSDSM